MLHALVLAAQALPVGDRAKDARAEQAITLRLEGAVVDGFRLGDFTMRPAPDLFRRSHTDLDGIEIRYCVSEVERARTIQGVLLRHSRLPLSAPTCSTQYSVPGTQLISVQQRGAKLLDRDPKIFLQLRLPFWKLATGNWEVLIRRYSRGLLGLEVDQLNIETQCLQFADEHVERLRDARLDGRFALHDGLVDLGAAIHVVGFRRQQLLQDVSRAISLQRPD